VGAELVQVLQTWGSLSAELFDGLNWKQALPSQDHEGSSGSMCEDCAFAGQHCFQQEAVRFRATPGLPNESLCRLELINALVPLMPHESLDSFFFWNSGA
jgi:hypothetical protein